MTTRTTSTTPLRALIHGGLRKPTPPQLPHCPSATHEKSPQHGGAGHPPQRVGFPVGGL